MEQTVALLLLQNCHLHVRPPNQTRFLPKGDVQDLDISATPIHRLCGFAVWPHLLQWIGAAIPYTPCWQVWQLQEESIHVCYLGQLYNIAKWLVLLCFARISTKIL